MSFQLEFLLLIARVSPNSNPWQNLIWNGPHHRSPWIYVWMWDMGHKESWALKNWCFWTVVLAKALEGPLNCKEIKPVNPKGNQSWIFVGRTDAEAPILWPPDAKNWLIRKDPDAGKGRRQEEEGNNRGWDGWMASPTQWTWVWANSQSWW